eukprot:GILJ01002710.1.p1 GENE.GILJ01002710.1~~GILJ01002710.1.p1  ORF type:complete len:385 (-),score=55.23 GILJ01002710.1:152-1306(-)
MLQDLFDEDIDSVLGFRTKKLVSIKDRRLGFIHRGVQFAVVLYIIVYVVFINKGYLKTELQTGSVITAVEGETITRENNALKYWDSTEAAYPPLEPGGVFIATKVLLTKQQTRGVCADPAMPCTDSSQCTRGLGQCKNKVCMETQWCPAEDPTDQIVTETFPLTGTADFLIWFKGSIKFMDSETQFSTMVDRDPVIWPDDGANTYSVADLMEIAGTTFEAVKDSGAIFDVLLYWSCNLDLSSRCSPSLVVTRVDASSTNPRGSGFSYRRAVYYGSGDSESRDLYKMTGIRFLVRSTGVGYRISMEAVMLQLSSAMSLLTVAQVVADFMMLYILPERKRYAAKKYDQTKDFSDMLEELERKQKDKEMEPKEGQIAVDYTEEDDQM